MMKKKMRCDTCGKEVDNLLRDVLDAGYNALNKKPLWNCAECYEEKRASRDKDKKAN
jgi:uncharacterized protein with PIN domain